MPQGILLLDDLRNVIRIVKTKTITKMFSIAQIQLAKSHMMQILYTKKILTWCEGRVVTYMYEKTLFYQKKLSSLQVAYIIKPERALHYLFYIEAS